MEIPFDYILISIMMNLKVRDLETKISKKNLIKIIDIIICNLECSDKEKLRIVNDFDFDYELDAFYSENAEYFEIVQDNIVFNEDISVDELENILDENDIDELILDTIDDMLQTNISVIELMGIKIRKDLYKWLILSLREEEEMYGKLLFARKNKNSLLEEKTIKEIKINNLVRRIYFINLDNIDLSDLYDLSLYSDDMAKNAAIEIIPFNIENNVFDERNIYHNPFQRTLFFDDSPIIYSASYKLNNDLNKKLGMESVACKSDYKFYLKYYYLLCEEIDTLSDSKLKNELEITKYRLMMTLDGMFDNTLFMNKDNGVLEDYESKYKFNGLEARFFINEILSYTDKMYEHKDSYVIEYFNIIKKIFIKTYYLLTKDDSIINEIRENKLYGVNKISTEYLDDILNNPRRRIK